MSTLPEQSEMREAMLAASGFASASSLLELPEIRQIAYPISVEAYHLLTEDQKTELLRGVIVRKVSKSPQHRSHSVRILMILMRQITPEFQVFPEGPLTLADSEPEPDVAVVRGSAAEFDQKHPDTAELVIEVAVSSLRIDRLKASVYAEAAVKEYWILRPERKQVEVYRQPSEEGYVEKLIVTAPAVLHPVALPGVSVDLTELFA